MRRIGPNVFGIGLAALNVDGKAEMRGPGDVR